jgi:hypothetical protein
MPRLSLWRDNHSNDYKFFDRRISEMFTVGGTGVLVHKYMGTRNQGVDDATQPEYTNQSEQNIQDLLFLENRDRIYDTTVYSMRGIYQVSDSDFDLTQFGLFLATGTLFLTFHINDMVETLGRRIVSGDVIELIHLTDYNALNDIPMALKRFFIVGDCQRASEGFSPTWWPHLWRCKINPLVDSQEYKDILNKIQTGSDGSSSSLRDIISTYNTYNTINEAIIEQAEKDVPMSGYDTSGIFIQPLDENGRAAASKIVTADNAAMNTIIGADASDEITADEALISPDAKVSGWLTGDGKTPNGFPVVSGISFPAGAASGDYCLRVDYTPNRLFRFDGKRWVKIEDVVRTPLTPGLTNRTLKSGFVNNQRTFTDGAGTHAERQGLSQALKPKADNQ